MGGLPKDKGQLEKSHKLGVVWVSRYMQRMNLHILSNSVGNFTWAICRVAQKGPFEGLKLRWPCVSQLLLWPQTSSNSPC